MSLEFLKDGGMPCDKRPTSDLSFLGKYSALLYEFMDLEFDAVFLANFLNPQTTMLLWCTHNFINQITF